MLMILADAVAATTSTDLLPVISSMGSIGFAVWFGGYTTMYTIPKMQDKHAEAIKELVGEMREQREAFDRWRMSHQ